MLLVTLAIALLLEGLACRVEGGALITRPRLSFLWLQLVIRLSRLLLSMCTLLLLHVVDEIAQLHVVFCRLRAAALNLSGDCLQPVVLLSRLLLVLRDLLSQFLDFVSSATDLFRQLADYCYELREEWSAAPARPCRSIA